MKDLLFADIATLGRHLRAGQVTCVELARACLERSAANRHLNAWIRLAPEEALTAAAQLDTELRQGRDRGPLHGIPVGIKDNIDVAGLPTTGGTRPGWGPAAERRRRAIDGPPLPDGITPAGQDAAAVARLRAAGAVILGKNHLHELAYGVSGRNPHWGDCQNPWQTGYATGGSSSGSGAAVAAGLCAASVGTDTSGSVRIPAAACGVAGLKTARGRVSLKGVLPGIPQLDTVGPLARTVADLALLDAVLAGQPLPSPDREPGIAGMRLGVWQEALGAHLEPEVRSAFDRVLANLQGAGAIISEVHLGDPVAQLDLVNAIGLPVTTYLLGDGEGCGDDVRSYLTAGGAMTALDYLDGQAAVLRLQGQWQAALAQVQAVLSPMLPVRVPRLDAPAAQFDALMYHASLFNLVGAPALALPCGRDAAGLPIGLQVGAPDEATALRVGAAWAAICPPVHPTLP